MGLRKQHVEIFKEVKVIESDKFQSQIQRICQKTLGKTFTRFGWNYKYDTFKADHPVDGKFLFLAKVVLYKSQKRERDDSADVFHRQSHDVLTRFLSYCQQNEWQIKEESNDILANKIIESQQNFDFELPQNVEPYFAHLFDRDPQIRIVYNAIAAAKASEFRVRNHCLLWGKPACAKTDILLAFEKMLGRENVLRLDATATSKAGAENLFLEGSVPPIVILEEAEKCNPANLPWLLGILDKRGEIIKTTARTDGPNRKEAKCLCLATVNNLAEFNTVMSGALSSRFQHKIYCPRPNRVVLEMILRRELAEVKGDEAWVNPILDYVLNVEKTNDPRRIIALLDGREKWLTGEYKEDLLAIREAMETDEVDEFRTK